MNNGARQGREAVQEMYQVQVTDKKGNLILIGPAVSDAEVLTPLCQAINVAVATRKERDWRDATIVTHTTIKQ